MNEASKIINKLMEYYNVHTISELAQVIKIGQPAISKWKNNNSINPIRKKCLELGIYDIIFEDEINKIKIDHSDDFESSNDNYFDKLSEKISEITSSLNFINVDERIIDKPTFDLFKESYIKAIMSNDLKEFRIHLIDYTFEFYFFEFDKNNKIEESILTMINELSINEQIIDKPTFDLFKESYIKAIQHDDLKQFRIHLMDYTFKIYKLMSNPV